MSSEEIRLSLGLSQERIDAYDPAEMVSKLGKQWTLTTYEGKCHPCLFKTRKEAIEAGEKHKALKQAQFDKPNAYFDLVRLKAAIASVESNPNH